MSLKYFKIGPNFGLMEIEVMLLYAEFRNDYTNLELLNEKISIFSI